jgi:hypothetical protein
MITQSKPKAQVSAPQFQHPSITPDVMAILRNYEIAAAVLSWDNFTYGTPCQITPGDITNIAFDEDVVWYRIGYHRSILIDIETFQSHWSQIQQKLEAKKLEAQCKAQLIQPAGMAGDSVSSQLQPNWEAIADYESGKNHGRLDAANGSHLMCEEASCPYSQGYLDGYNSFKPKPQPEIKQLPQWRVTWNTKWCWYEVWAGNAHIGRASNHEEAERIAQKYIASEQLRQQHRELVLAAYAR